MKKCLALALLFAALAMPAAALAQSGPAQVAGSTGNTYSVTWPDQETPSSFAAITTATTTLVIQGVAGQCIYAWYIGTLATGTNSSAQAVWFYGPNSSTLTAMFLQDGFGIGTSFGNFTGAWSGYQGIIGQPIPAPIPYIIPAGMSLYVLSQGATFNFKPYIRYAIHG